MARGHIRKKPSGSWELTVELPRDPRTEKRRQYTETVRGTKKEADLKLAELIERIGKNSFTKPGRITFGQWNMRWYTGYVIPNTGPRTSASYKTELDNHINPGLGAIPLVKLEDRHIEEHYDYELKWGKLDGSGGLSKTSVLYQHRIISESLKHAVKLGYLIHNVAELVTPPRRDRKVMSTLSPNHIPRFLVAIRSHPYYIPFYTAFATGNRPSELLGLTWQNVNLDEGFISVTQTLLKRSGLLKLIEPKTAYSRRRITLPATLVRILREHRRAREVEGQETGRPLEESDFVFGHPGNRPLDPSTINHAFTRMLREAGIPHIRFYDLRHTHATLLLAAGVDVKTISERLGHASVAFTMDTYAHVLPGTQAAAAESFDRVIMAGLLESSDIKNPPYRPVMPSSLAFRWL